MIAKNVWGTNYIGSKKARRGHSKKKNTTSRTSSPSSPSLLFLRAEPHAYGEDRQEALEPMVLKTIGEP